MKTLEKAEMLERSKVSLAQQPACGHQAPPADWACPTRRSAAPGAGILLAGSHVRFPSAPRPASTTLCCAVQPGHQPARVRMQPGSAPLGRG